MHNRPLFCRVLLHSARTLGISPNSNNSIVKLISTPSKKSLMNGKFPASPQHNCIVGANFLRLIFMIVMVIFTIPYLATQAIGAGLIIEYVTGSVIIWKIGALITMIIIMFYVLTGGMRGSGWTDVIQGAIMIIAMTVATIFISINLGGFENANNLAYNVRPELFSRPGGGEYFRLSLENGIRRRERKREHDR